MKKKVREGYKMTELGEIPKEWEIRYLEEICEILDNYRKPIKASERENIKGDIPYYGASGVIDWINDYIFDEDLILLGEDGENLNSRNTELAFKISGKSWVNNHAHVFKIKNNKINNIDFIVYYLESKDYSKYIAGSAQPKITQAQCRKILLPVPSLEEQEKIASILSTVDEQIDNVDALIEKNKELKKGLMQTLLTKGIGHTKFKKTEIGEIPEEWEVKKLNDISRVIGDGLHGTPIYSESGDYCFINGNNLVNGRIDIDENTKRVDLQEFDKYKKDLNDDTILISLNGTIGNLAFYKNEKVVLGKSTGYISLILSVNKEYIYYLLSSSRIKKYFIKELTGTTIKNLSLNTLRDAKIEIPKLKEQEKIASILSEVDKKIDEYENKKEKLEELKRGLMQQLLSGNIRTI